MNGPLPDGDGNIIDIFVLSSSETLAPVLREHLEQNGYHVTVFTDDANILEILKSGKPNLLVCDATDQEARTYEVCKQIKADRHLYVIPVLILTRGTELSDLLFVLDCNADNFISFPYDLPYFRSLISGMLDTPVERPTPEQIKTQFRIQHNDHVFLVTADRRKLLEFLLSSFEIAVSRHGEIDDAKERIQLLEESVDALRKEALENSRTVKSLQDKLEDKEQGLSALRADISEKNRLIELKSREIDSLNADREEDLKHLTETKNQLELITQKNSENARSYESAINALEEKASSLAARADSLASEIEKAEDALRKVSEEYTVAERNLADLRVQKDATDKALVNRTREYNEINATCERERTRAAVAEGQVTSALAAKAEIEVELQRIINEQKAALQQQESEIARYNERLASEEKRYADLEQQFHTIEEERKKADDAGQKTRNLLAVEKENVAVQEKKIDDLGNALREKETEATRFREMYEETEARCTNLEVRINSLERGMEQERTDSVEKIEKLQERLADVEVQYTAAAAAIEEKEAQLAALRDDNASARLALEKADSTIRRISAELDTTRSALNEERQDRNAREEEIIEMAAERDRAVAEVSAISRTHEEARFSHTNDLERFRAEEARLSGIIRDQESALESLRGVHNEVKTDRDLHRNDLVKARTDLDIVTSESRAKIQSLEQDLRDAESKSAKTGQQARSLAEELEQTRAALDTERRLRHVAEDSLRSALAAHERSGQEIGKLVTTKESLDAAIGSERQSRQDAELAADAARGELALVRQQLVATEQQSHSRAEELEDAREKIQALEKILAAVTKEKELARNEASALSMEIDQARSALADEWEDHMKDQEQLRIADEECGKTQEAVILVTETKLPVTTTPAKPPMIIPVDSEPDTLEIYGVEDLFEEPSGETGPFNNDPPARQSPTMPAEAKIANPAMDEDISDGDTTEAGEVDPYETEEDAELGEAESSIPEKTRGQEASAGISFNRTQWFDLLRWSHHSGALTQEQRMQIVRMGRLIQRGRRLTQKQEEQVLEMISLAQTLGYRFVS